MRYDYKNVIAMGVAAGIAVGNIFHLSNSGHPNGELHPERPARQRVDFPSTTTNATQYANQMQAPDVVVAVSTATATFPSSVSH